MCPQWTTCPSEPHSLPHCVKKYAVCQSERAYEKELSCCSGGRWGHGPGCLGSRPAMAFLSKLQLALLIVRQTFPPPFGSHAGWSGAHKASSTQCLQPGREILDLNAASELPSSPREWELWKVSEQGREAVCSNFSEYAAGCRWKRSGCQGVRAVRPC